MGAKLDLPIPVQRGTPKKRGKLREYVEALLTAFIFAFLIRSFVVEAFKIPSASMVPTLMIGDHLFVNKFVYGIRLPFSKKWVAHFKTPQRGEMVVFMYPMDEGKDFVKRVVGLPHDQIKIRGDDLWINGEPVTRETVSHDNDLENYQFYIEKLGNIKHLVQYDAEPSLEEQEFEVPEGHLFVMGDNRDNSSDSRVWGFVPMENLKGRALFIWLSIDYDRKNLRWNRFGKWLE